MYREEIDNFLKVINSDFYTRLPLYEMYMNESFNTDSFTITDLAAISECLWLNRPKSPDTSTNIERLFSVILYRLNASEESYARPVVMAELMNISCFASHKKINFRGYSSMSYDGVRVAEAKPDGINILFDHDGKALVIKSDGNEKKYVLATPYDTSTMVEV